MARKFLYLIAILIMLAIAAAFAYRLFGVQIMRTAMVPTAKFEPQEKATASVYADPAMWFSRPGKADDPARWVPAGYQPGAAPNAAVFYVHPTSYLNRARWNAPLDDAEANGRATLFLRGQATAFNAVGEIWAPRYRQATFGAFLTSEAAAGQALDLAYGDVLTAFDQFLNEIGPDRPIILAGHSQGALHLTRLLKDRVAATPLAARIVAAYVVGWPVSKTADLPALGLPQCEAADQAGCILSWQTFAEPADPALIFDTFDKTDGYTGAPRAGTDMVCTNPITGTPDSTAPASANLGTLFPSADLLNADIEPGMISATCEGRGILSVGPPPSLVGNYVLPGNNYHVFDYSLFWANIRTDAQRRFDSYQND
ncbi:DUF3089 domain-containing protein [Hephaestia sp. GCM10023244]|uniref:DUF3089 domain-containing protein n=1 Tax=unclassified Hephaestia TaxID=2631281 RepID=UPI002077955D|nr:DUF3089 domain-containing protein [Hephaestia sp. MAHUQ-44]MCM8730036.1 DUF3089 domain-containing protein [Hephaestia sp. MAHUQ-44]